ncbi:amino acid permease-domain-containing protein [Glomus cerebriforme]|uniref:Amino acid permease-domain-containing protein n=1 Tax=Glomus cerebriforme TaxID=658196 RepID=A0A397SHZ8_9GLOM|nr:amino acid permease-domain-containing protein [Glomus cerebriforme]
MSINNDDITPSKDNEIREPMYGMSINENPKERNPNSSNKLLGVFYGIGMNVNTIIGSGIVTTPGIIWNLVKSPIVVLLLWFVGGIVSMAGSLSYVELGVIHKISGGETKYLQTAYPQPRIMMSYLFSFMHIFAIRPGIISAVLQSAAQYFWYTLKEHQYDDGIDINTNGWKLPFTPFWYVKLLAIAFLLIITAYHMFNTRWAIYINQTLAVIKLITYSIIAIAGIYRLFADWPTSRTNWQNSLNGNSDITAYSASILLITFSYDGWNSLNYSLDEFRKPEKKLIFSNSISVGIVILVYLLINIAFISVVPAEAILDNDKSSYETIAVVFFYKLFGQSPVTVRIFTALVVLSVIGTAATGIWSLFGVHLLSYSLEVIRYRNKGNLKKEKNDKELNEKSDRSSKIEYEVSLFFVGIFILAGLFILIFSFMVHVECPNYNPNCSLREKRIEQMSPMLISYGFLIIALLFYLFYYCLDTLKRQREAKIIRIADK